MITYLKIIFYEISKIIKNGISLIFQLQFMAVALHSINLLYLGCEGSKALMVFIMAHAILFLVLFSEFYSQAYSKDKSKKPIKVCILNIRTKSPFQLLTFIRFIFILSST